MLFATNGLLPFVWMSVGKGGSCTETMEQVVRGSDLVEIIIICGSAHHPL